MAAQSDPRSTSKAAEAASGDTTTTVIELGQLLHTHDLSPSSKSTTAVLETSRSGDAGGDDDSNTGGEDASLGIGQALRRYPRLAGWALALSTAIILTGFDINIVSNVATLPEFQYVRLLPRRTLAVVLFS